jgi:hypothetical protein
MRIAILIGFLAGSFLASQAPSNSANDLASVVRDLRSRTFENLSSNPNIVEDLQRDIGLLTSLLNSGKLAKLDGIAARYQRAAAVCKLNAILKGSGQPIDLNATQQALDDFDKVIAEDIDIPAWGVMIANAEYYAGIVAFQQTQSDALQIAYTKKCAERGHPGCMNIIAEAHLTGRGGESVDIADALDMHKRVFGTGTKGRCAGAYSARSIASIIYFTGVRLPHEDELAWMQKSYGLSDQIEVGEKSKDACDGSQARIEEFLYRLTKGERRDDILAQANERLGESASAGKAVIQYLSGSIDSDAFESAVGTAKTARARCNGYFDGMWYAELTKKRDLAERFHHQLEEVGEHDCGEDLVYAKKFKF